MQKLDPAHEDRHTLDPDRAHNRESLVWVLPLVEHGLGLVAYTWVDAFGKAGCAGIAFGPGLETPVFERHDDIPVPDDMTFERWEVGPLTTALVEPQKSSTVAYAGERLTMDFTFESTHAPYSYGFHPEPFPSFFADDRLEQSGRATGTVTVDGTEHTIDGFCHRDHAFGARHWGGTLHYKWFNFLADGTAVHVQDVQGYGRSAVRGYVHRDGDTAEIVAADFDYVLDDDFFHRTLNCTFTDERDRETVVTLGDSHAEIEYPIAPEMVLFDIVGEVEIAGQPGVCYAEMAWPPEYLERNR